MHVKNQFLARACAAAVAGVALSTVAVTAASASGGGGVPVRPGAISPAGLVAGGGGALRPASKDHATGQGATLANNRYFAGYATVVATGSATVAAASFTVPALSCTTADLAIAPGAFVAANNYKFSSGAFGFIGCVNGAATYYPTLVVNGAGTEYKGSPFAAGDVVDLITKVSTNRTSVQVTDVTKNVTEKLTGAGASADAAWIGDDGWGDSTVPLYGVPNFGKLTFKNSSIDYKALGGWHPQAIQRVNGSTVQITPGNFWPGGTAFTTHYQHS